jgi:glycosyltransferase involved in cell wall biosynthesis
MSHLIGYIRQAQPSGIRYTFVVGPGVVNEDQLPEGVTVREVAPSQKKALDRAGGPLSGFIFWRVLKRWLAELTPDRLIILDLTWLELPLCFHRLPCPFSGILIVQYPELLAGARTGWKRRMRFRWKELKTGRFLRRARPQKIFLLNGAYSCEYLNRRFGVSCYEPIPDPVPELAAEPGFSFREAYGIAPGRRLFLFFGSMSARKGVGRLVEAIGSISKEAAQQSAFVFCGKPEAAYEAQYRRLISRLVRLRPDIGLKAEATFVTSERMRALFEQADWILMPYSRPEYSSGILIHAAASGTPVLGPEGGLIGRQIREHGLGWAVPPGGLADSIEKAAGQIYRFDEEKRLAFVASSRPDRMAGAVLEI